MKTDIFDNLKSYGKVLKDEPMSNYTSFKTGGCADYLVYPASMDKCAELIEYLNKSECGYTVLGGCTNLVVGDMGIRGVVIIISDLTEGFNEIKVVDENTIYAGAGVKKSEFINFTAENCFDGMHFMVGIPGCIGGGIIMNAGTYMGTFSSVLKKVYFINNRGQSKSKEIDSTMGQYRHLDLEAECAVVTGADFSLPKSDNKDLVIQKINDIIEDRKQKHPWDYPSAGSVFKNPENEASWKLVNDCGLKGYSIGGAQVSEKHTNFIINKGEANSAEIRALVSYIQSQVKIKYGIELHTEIRMIGEFH
ncbi:MAG: UDP-N-acetylmuramate dehydrogenase [Spirochaetes bacterium]|nr:UDP-N-acetylmuramate dehydrogenase [Spirochaetota bacterium]MBN2769812.1 UDP-N-acetylmuramate dehydrogenase [Spirochaetota bacterium]